jgi:hypothetical protein
MGDKNRAISAIYSSVDRFYWLSIPNSISLANEGMFCSRSTITRPLKFFLIKKTLHEPTRTIYALPIQSGAVQNHVKVPNIIKVLA